MADVISPTDVMAPSATDNTLCELMGYNLRRTSNVFQQDLACALRPLNLRMVTYSLLAMVVENRGLRQSQLADALAMERSNCVAIVDELEKAGAITRIRVPTDRRAYALEPTEYGLALCAKATAAIQLREAELLSLFSASERKHIRSAMALLGVLNKRHPIT